jgi:hypothetical protein
MSGGEDADVPTGRGPRQVHLRTIAFAGFAMEAWRIFATQREMLPATPPR